MRFTKVLLIFIVFLFSTNYIKAQSCITLSSPAGTDDQKVCINTPIINITYTLGLGVTVSSLTGLPTGVTWASGSGLLTISGTPTLSGIFNYKVTTSGICSGTHEAKGTITVIDAPSAPTGTTPQSFCAINNPTVADLTATGTGIKWYLSSSGGTALATTTTLTTNIYYASQTVDGCESTSRLAVIVLVNDPLAPTGISPQSFCTSNNPTVASLVATGNGIKWYTVPTGGTALASTTALVNGTYYASQTISGCESTSRLSVVVTISNPSAPSAASPQVFCASSNPTIADLTATGTGIKWYLTSTGGTALATTTTLVTGVYYASQTVSSCESTSRIAVVVSVNNPAAPTGNVNQVFCSINNPTVANLTATGTGIKWYLTSTGGIALATTTALVTGVYYASQTVGGCESISRLAVNVSVNNTVAPTGSSAQTFCSITNPTVANLTATGTGVLWYSTSTGGLALASTTPLVTGNYYASQTIGGCESVSRLAVAVTVNQTPVSVAGTGGDVCGLSFTLNATAPTIGTGIWTQTSGPGTSVFSPNANTPNAIVTVSVYGTYTFTWTVVNNDCSNLSTVTVNFYQQPLANAGIGGTECDLNFVLNAIPSVGLGTWAIVTGTGTAIYTPNANAPGATVTVSAYGTYTFRWTETNGTCISSSVVTVNFYQQPVANAGSGGDACNLNFALNAISSAGIGTWTMTSGTGTAIFTPNANSPTATVTVFEYGTKEFTWTEVNGICSDSSTIMVNFYEQPTADAGTGGNNCGLEFNLGAVPSLGIGTWTRDSGSGSVTFSPNSNTPGAKVTVTTYGTQVLRWTEVNGTCSSSATVTVTFIQQPAADAGTGGNECDLNFVLNAVPGTGTGTWTKVSGPGTVVFIPNANQYNATVTVSQFGSYDFAWTEVNSLCSSVDIVRVIFHDLPPVNAGTDMLLCKGKSIQLNASGSGSFSWSPANLLNNPYIYNPVATPEATTSFTVTLTDQWGCKNSDQVNVEVRVQPVADAGPDQMLEFLFETNLQAVAPGTNQTGEWTLLEGEGEISDVNNPSTRVSDLSLEVNSFIWSVSNGICPLSTDTVNIIVHNLIIPTLITPNLDGNNDYFVIKGIESFGQTSLTVFNRWGAKVYESNKYDNSWEGVDDNENPLPEDTYFYILKPEKIKTLKGYVVIRR
jgi:gliding motility-associated-like protein